MAAHAYLPAKSCECHVHVVGPMAEYPMLAERHYTPGPAPVEALREHLVRNRLARVVIVHPVSMAATTAACLKACASLPVPRGVSPSWMMT